MALNLEDLINKKKEPSQILDLSKVKIRTKEEFEKYIDKIPEFKIRPEKVRPEDARIRDTDFTFTHNRKESRSLKREFSYGDPVPPSMRSVRLEDLAGVDINWRMLTVCRPKNRLEEDLFSRLVELGKLRITTERLEAKLIGSTSGGLPPAQAHLISLGIHPCKTKRGTVETRIKSCKECGEELCQGKWCKEFHYDNYTRMILDNEELVNPEAEQLAKSTKKNSKKKKRKPKKVIRRSNSPKKKCKIKKLKHKGKPNRFTRKSSADGEAPSD